MLLKIMTFNLRFASATPPNAWAQRRPVVSECLRLASPDVIGTQEGLYQQLKDIAADRPEYDWIGLGREGGSRGEFMAVFYRKDRLEPLEFDHFWLSDFPGVIASKTWGNNCVRMLTRVRFRDRQTGREFNFWNTHFDHEVQVAREKAAALVLQKTRELDTSEPLILVGDFNAPARQSVEYDLLIEGGFCDAFPQEPEFSTFHNYQPLCAGPRIDWILTRGEITIVETQIVTFEQNGQRPSDHLPVTATLSLG